MPLGTAACQQPAPARHPVAMEPLPPPEPAPHQATSVPVDGAGVYEADDTISVESDVPELLRAYATPTHLALIGRNPGQATLTIKLKSGDLFLFDVTITNEPPDRHVVIVGEQALLPLEGLTDLTFSGDQVTTAKSADGKQLVVTGAKPGIALGLMTFPDATTKPIELMVVGGTRLL